MLGTAVSACGSAAPGGSSRLPLQPCTVGTIAWARCGSLSVLENPAKPDGRHISIRVVVLPARGSKRASDPLFYFDGGPGGAASDPVTVEWAAKAFQSLNVDRDMVFVDQRGTGGSNMMECQALMGLGYTSAGGLPTPAAVTSAAKACLSSTAAAGDPAMYTTPMFVDDVDQVRAALGYRSIDLYGVSYGVTSALTYIQRHGAHVRAAVLDSGSLLDTRLWERMAASLQASLDSVLTRCAADARCGAAYPHLSTQLAAVIARVTASPLTVSFPDTRTGKTVTSTLNEATFASALSSMLGNTEEMAQLPAFVYTAYLGEWPLLAQNLASSAQTDDPQTTYVMARTIECSDAWAQQDPAAAAAEGGSSVFTTMEVDNATLQQEFCAAWPAAIGASGTVSTDAPVVFLNGTADPADPPANVAGAISTMPNSLIVPVQGYGHWQLSQDSSGCLAQEASTFIARGVPSAAADWPCAQHPPFPPFSFG